ncbi:MAG: PAS domain S-box protein [Ramlibacter sp.]|nr:PAS domain S-box protein [Ramlibacter sp.]
MKWTFGLRTALILLVLIAVVPVFGVVIQSSLAEQKHRIERAEAGLHSLVDLAAAYQEQLIEGARQMLTAVAHAPPVYRNDPQDCERYFRDLRARYPRYANFGLLDTQGRLTCRAVGDQREVQVADRGYFKRAVGNGEFSIGDYQVGRVTGKPSIAFAMPVYREDQSLRGVIFLALDLERADEQLRKLATPPGTSLFVTDGTGTVLASTGAEAAAVGGSVLEPLRQAMGLGDARPRLGTRPAGDAAHLYAVRRVGHPREGEVLVSAALSRADVLAPTVRRLYLQLAALLAIVLLGAGAAWAFGDRVLAAPLDRLLRRVGALQREELPLDAQPAPRRIRELDELDERFNTMARSLIQRAVERDGALAEMQGQKSLLTSVFESLAEGVLVADSRGYYIHVNAAALQIAPGIPLINREKDPLDVSAREYGFFQLDGRTLMPAWDRPTVRALRGERVDRQRFLCRGVWTAGVEKIIQASARPLLGADEQSAGCVLVLSDITATYRAEEALRDSEHRYRTLFEANPHPMWVFDTQTLRFLTVNDAAVNHYGYTRAEFLSMSLDDIRPQEELPALHDHLATLGSEAGRTRVWRHLRKDGSVILVEVSSHALDFDGRPARMVLAHDVTGRVRAREALEQLNETLEQRVAERTRDLALANKELESFSYSVSHDLRAPLQVIDGFGKALLTRHATELDGKAQHYLSRIRENTGQMAQLIDDLLSLSRVSRTPLRVEPVDLSARAHQIAEGLRARFPHQQVAVDIEPGLSCMGDAGLLSVVLENLMGNAWKFSRGVEQPRIRVGRRPATGGEAVFFVADNGAGFDMTYRDKLFTAFQRLHSDREFEGTGIGLATVLRIVSRHGGRVAAESAPGQGAVFEFTLKEGTHHEHQSHSPG